MHSNEIRVIFICLQNKFTIAPRFHELWVFLKLGAFNQSQVYNTLFLPNYFSHTIYIFQTIYLLDLLFDQSQKNGQQKYIDILSIFQLKFISLYFRAVRGSY